MSLQFNGDIMAMTPVQMVSFFSEQATLWSQGLKSAVEKSDYHHAASCARQIFQSDLMQGLIRWRIGSGSPVEALKSAVQAMYQAVDTISRMKDANPSRDLPLDSAAIIAYLVDLPSPNFTTTELTADRLLDAVLSNGLRGTWNDSAWNTGLEQLRKNKRAVLAVESYSTYNRLLKVDRAESVGLVEFATKLFEKRAKDGFFSGGEQTEGGGPDNATTVDYRLAAVMKKIGHSSENVHRWQWS